MTTGEHTCDWCGDTATVWDKRNEEYACEQCARHWFGVRLGEALAVGFAIEHMIEQAKCAGATPAEISAAVDAALDGRQPLLGAARAEADAIHAEHRAGIDTGDRDCSAGRWTVHFEPIAGDAAAWDLPALASFGDQLRTAERGDA